MGSFQIELASKCMSTGPIILTGNGQSTVKNILLYTNSSFSFRSPAAIFPSPEFYVTCQDDICSGGAVVVLSPARNPH